VKFGITLETAMLHLIAGRVHSEGAGKYEGEMRERNRILNIVKNVKHQRFRKVNMALDRIIEDVDKPSHPKGKLDGIHGERLVDNDK
jgi:hypothetical protein